MRGSRGPDAGLVSSMAAAWRTALASLAGASGKDGAHDLAESDGRSGLALLWIWIGLGWLLDMDWYGLDMDMDWIC